MTPQVKHLLKTLNTCLLGDETSTYGHKYKVSIRHMMMVDIWNQSTCDISASPLFCWMVSISSFLMKPFSLSKKARIGVENILQVHGFVTLAGSQMNPTIYVQYYCFSEFRSFVHITFTSDIVISVSIFYEVRSMFRLVCYNVSVGNPRCINNYIFFIQKLPCFLCNISNRVGAWNIVRECEETLDASAIIYPQKMT